MNTHILCTHIFTTRFFFLLFHLDLEVCSTATKVSRSCYTSQQTLQHNRSTDLRNPYRAGADPRFHLTASASSEIEIENVIASLQLAFNPLPRSVKARIFRAAGSIPTKHKFIYLAEPNGEDGKQHSLLPYDDDVS